MVGNRQTQNSFGKQTKWILLSNILFQTQQRPNRKKVVVFWRQSGKQGGNLPENPEKATRPSLGFDTKNKNIVFFRFRRRLWSSNQTSTLFSTTANFILKEEISFCGNQKKTKLLTLVVILMSIFKKTTNFCCTLRGKFPISKITSVRS